MYEMLVQNRKKWKEYSFFFFFGVTDDNDFFWCRLAMIWNILQTFLQSVVFSGSELFQHL